MGLCFCVVLADNVFVIFSCFRRNQAEPAPAYYSTHLPTASQPQNQSTTQAGLNTPDLDGYELPLDNMGYQDLKGKDEVSNYQGLYAQVP